MEFPMQSKTKIIGTLAHSLNDPTNFLLNQVWPPAVVAVGLVLTGVWISLLGYALVSAVGIRW